MDELEQARRELTERARSAAEQEQRDTVARRQCVQALADAHAPLWKDVFVELVRIHVNHMTLEPCWRDRLFRPGYTHWKLPGRRGGAPPVSIDHILTAENLGAMFSGATGETQKSEVKMLYGMRVTEHLGSPFRVSWTGGMIAISCYG